MINQAILRNDIKKCTEVNKYIACYLGLVSIATISGAHNLPYIVSSGNGPRLRAARGDYDYP